MIIGDWNAKVESTEEFRTVGKYGLRTRNEAGERLIEFCEANDLFIANTFFKVSRQWLYAWTSLDGQYRNQIDYIVGGGAQFWQQQQDLELTVAH